MASQGESLEPLTYKTWVLKVSIHCQGCKRKVNKILHAIEGVYTVDIDLKQQKVIVKGNVAAETLIRKLIKSGKHAELWPEPAPEQKMKKPRKSKKKDKDNEGNSTSEEEEDDEDDEQNDHSAPDAQNQADPPGKILGGGTLAVTGGAGNQPPVAGKKEGEIGVVAEKTGSGGKRKKKKKKGHKTVTIVEPTGGGGPTGTLPQDHYPSPTPINLGPPPHHGYHQFPMHGHAPSPVPSPVPMYAVSYNTTYPTTEYRTSYYSTPPPPSYPTNISHTTPYCTSPSRYSYGYDYNGPQVESPPSDSEYYRRKSSGSLELFSDENPNGCLIM